ncbi:MAG: hypothetical protein DYG88_01855 [Chloroflexi bacterium CFX4]|nr:hypothetical protein [Chloroflexi bacterium CFX4]MDL1922396.1 hypothetical protein [Chloroflexi bacterium CFX3]
MKQVALVTFVKRPLLVESERRVIEPLFRRGVRVSICVWDDPAVDWQAFDAVILRGTWDYHHKSAAFRAWLARLEAQSVRVFNPAPIIAWNMDKHYLRDLAGEGVNIVPTLWLAQGAVADLATLLDEQGWQHAVVKPNISGGADNTWLVGRAEAAAHMERFQTNLASLPSGIMVQQFMPLVQSYGEWSFIFFNGIYSHAVLKRPAAESIYVQSHLGGSFERREPPPSLISHATAIMRAAARCTGARQPFLYARVDALDTFDELILMELEIFEPYLFLEADAYAPERFADAIRDALE